MRTETVHFSSLKRFPPNPNDGRLPIATLYDQYFKLWTNYSLEYQMIFPHEIDNTLVPSYVFYTRKKGPALWLITGIHAGKEPTGPNAFALNINLIGHFSKTFPIVVMPLCNPPGYIGAFYRLHGFSDYRGLSVCEAEYWLPYPVLPGRRYRDSHPSPESKAFGNLVINLATDYPPIHCVNLHDDFEVNPSYRFLNGEGEVAESLATFYVNTLVKLGIDYIHHEGKTLSGAEIKGGIQRNLQDGSIDELISALGCPFVFTSEMHSNHPLNQRIHAVRGFLNAIFYAHRNLHENLLELYSNMPKSRRKIIK